jgi:uncharacterized membrane protein YcfT
MTNPTPTQEITPASDKTSPTLPGPFRCLTGSVVSAIMAFGMYYLTAAIAASFAAKPIQSPNITVINITVAVRTLVVGISTLATGIFSLIALGLFALGIQVTIQRFKNKYHDQ